MADTRAPAGPSPAPTRAPIPRPRLPDRRAYMLDELRYRLSDPRLGAVVLGLVAVLAGAFWYVSGMRSGGAAPAATEEAIASAQEAAEQVDAAGEEPAVLTIHVAGAVATPGVVELVAGSRVIDAIEAVGGASADADLDQLNLAADLADGQRVLVPKTGEVLPAGDGVADPGGGEELLDLNTATKAALEELPGIGPVLADAIITDRDKRGGYRSVEDLRGVSGIGDKRFADIEDLVTVR